VDLLPALLFEIALALFLGYFVARRSTKVRAIKGGLGAQIFHYLGASAFIGTAPAVLLSAVVLRYGLLRNILIGAAFLAAAYLFLLAYAYFEARAETPSAA
jgi:hypothetical protein